jgi:AcrR family transcriptional regulator
MRRSEGQEPKNVEPSGSTQTREWVMDVAERLFAERGLDAVSVRDITKAANVNLGAINYHFGARQKLILAIFERRLIPLNQNRIRALNILEQTGESSPPGLEAVLAAFIRPMVEQGMDPRQGGMMFVKLMGRCMVESNPELDALLRRHFDSIGPRFNRALMWAVPKLSRDEVYWRMHLMVGALHHALLMMDREHPHGAKFRFGVDGYIGRLVDFAAAVFHAPLPKV